MWCLFYNCINNIWAKTKNSIFLSYVSTDTGCSISLNGFYIFLCVWMAWVALRMQENGILRALNFKFSSGSMPPNHPSSVGANHSCKILHPSLALCSGLNSSLYLYPVLYNASWYGVAASLNTAASDEILESRLLTDSDIFLIMLGGWFDLLCT